MRHELSNGSVLHSIKHCSAFSRGEGRQTTIQLSAPVAQLDRAPASEAVPLIGKCKHLLVFCGSIAAQIGLHHLGLARQHTRNGRGSSGISATFRRSPAPAIEIAVCSGDCRRRGARASTLESVFEPVSEVVIATSPDELASEIRLLPADYMDQVVGEIFEDEGATCTGKVAAQPMDVTSIGVGTIALLKCSGTASTTRGPKSWSAVVKVVDPDAPNAAGGTDPDSSVWSEIRAYRDDIFASQSPIFRGAKCYRIDDRGNGQHWLWIEDLSDYSGSHWGREEYLLAAKGIGQFNGAWLGKDASAVEWLPPQSRYENLETDSLLLRNQDNFLQQKDSEYFRAGVPGESFDRLISLRDLMPDFARAASHVPRTIAHNDCHIRNLFAAPDLTEIVMIDFAGVATNRRDRNAGEINHDNLSQVRCRE